MAWSDTPTVAQQIEDQAGPTARQTHLNGVDLRSWRDLGRRFMAAPLEMAGIYSAFVLQRRRLPPNYIFAPMKLATARRYV